MLHDKIEQYFTRYPKLHILFLFDASGDYRQDFDVLDLPGCRKLVYDKNDFFLKYHLNGSWLNEKAVLYLPVPQPLTKEAMQSFPLLDLLLANKSIQPDDSIGDFMEKFGLQRHQRSLAEKYLADLSKKTVQDTAHPYLDAANFTEENIIHGLLATFVKFTQPESWEYILLRLLAMAQPGNENDWNRLSKKINEYRLEDFLLNKFHKLTGIQLSSWTIQDAAELLDKIKYNLYLQTQSEPAVNDPYKKYYCKSLAIVGSINIFHQRLLNHARYVAEWLALLESNSSAIHEKKLVEIYGYAADYGFYSNRLQWQIIEQIFQLAENEHSNVLTALDSLSPKATEKQAQFVLSFLHYGHKTINAIVGISSYILDQPDQYIKQYTINWYKIDQYYRKAIWLYRFQIDVADIPVALNWDIQLQTLNKHYQNYLEQVNRAWLKSWSKKEFTTDCLSIVPQFEFYKKEIAPLDQKVAVIISDGLRYEAGLELLENLNADAKNVAKTKIMLASVPSKTSIGMANLLPGKEFNFNEDNITIDGVPTGSYEKRQMLLQMAEPESLVVKLSEVLSNSRTINRDIFKKKVIYIYHDIIDSRGDKRASEHQTFAAVEDAILELTKFIKQLHATYNVAKVIITADHGFLYNDFVIADKDKEKGSGLDSIISHSRFELIKQKQTPELGYVFPLKNTTRFTDELFVVIPGSVNRYSKAGAGNQYVHGGASLQELIVPIIESTRKREDVSSLVSPLLMTKDLKIVSNLIKFSLLQEEPVSAREKERVIVAGLYRDSELISSEKEIELNRTGINPGERVFSVELHLLHGNSMDARYKLKIFDKADHSRLNPLIEADVKNQTLIQTDF